MPHIDGQDSDRFFQALTAMGLMFSDALSKQRQLLYWNMFNESLTIEEWEGACVLAMQHETFHKVPLPAQLMTYVQEFRAQQQQAQRRALLQEQMALMNHAAAEQRALEATPEWQAAQAAKMAEYTRLQEERERRAAEATAELDARWGPGWRKALEPETRYRPSGDQDLTYRPSVNAAERKAKLREQLKQLEEESNT